MQTRAKVDLRTLDSPALTMEAAIQIFMDSRIAKNLSTHTLDYYRFRFAAFIRFLKRMDLNVSPAEVSPKTIRDFLTEEIKSISPVTAGHSFITLRAFYRFLFNEGEISSNPMAKIEPIKQPKNVIDTFTVSHIQALLRICRKNFIGLRAKAIILTLLDCGLRVTELCELTLDDVEWKEQSLHVKGKGNTERIVPFGIAAKQALEQYLARRGHLEGTNAFFVTCYGDPMDRMAVLRVIKDCSQKAGISGVRCSPHTFRHTFAILFLRNGGDIFSLQKLLGHSDLTMTRRYASFLRLIL